MFNKKKFLLLKQINDFNVFMFLKKNDIIFFFENIINLNTLIFKRFEFFKLFKSYFFYYLFYNYNYEGFIQLLYLIFLNQEFNYGFLKLKFNYLFLSYCKFYNYLLYNLFLKKFILFVNTKTNIFFFFFLKKLVLFLFSFYGYIKSISKKSS